MSRVTALLAGRRMQLDSMVDTVTVKRRSGESFNNTTGQTTTTYIEQFTSNAKLGVGGLGSLIPTSRDDPAGGRTVTELRRIIWLPISAPQLFPDDIITVTAVGSDNDPQLLGRQLRVVAPIGQTWGTARRFSVEEVLA